ncbi:MAG: ASPIC/UnbV domain-containing protein [Armatimonadota bacterium]
MGSPRSRDSRESHDPTAHFGLGAHTTVDLRVTLPGGIEKSIEGIEADRAVIWDVIAGRATQ